MGRIDAVEASAENENSLEIYVGGAYLGTVQHKVWKRTGLKAGDELDAKRWETLRQEELPRAAQNRALYMIEAHALSQKELQDRLQEVGYDEDSIAVAMQKLIYYGYVNDADLARAICRYAQTQGKYGAWKLRNKLISRGIGRALMEEVLQEMDEGWEADALQEHLPVLYRKYAAQEDARKRRDKVAAALKRRGYDWEDITTALNKYEKMYRDDDD